MTARYRLTKTGIVLAVRVTPRGGRDRVDGWQADDHGVHLKLRVSAPPDKGQANDAVAALVARSLGVRPTAVVIVQGKTSRLKTIAVTGDPTVLSARVESLDRR